MSFRESGLQLLQQKHYSAYGFKKTDAIRKQVDQYGPDFRNLFNQTPLMVAAWMGNTEVIKALLHFQSQIGNQSGKQMGQYL